MRFPNSMVPLFVCSLSLFALPRDAAAGTFSLTVSDGISTKVVSDTDDDGMLQFLGTIGVFSYNLTGYSTPMIGDEYRSDLLLTGSVSNTSTLTKNASLTITLEDSGFTAAVGGSLPSELTSTVSGGLYSKTSLTTQSWVKGGTFSASTTSDVYNGSAFSGESTTEFEGSGPYSLLSKTTIMLKGGNYASFDLMTSVHTPEPASLVLLGSGLLGLARVARRRRGAAHG